MPPAPAPTSPTDGSASVEELYWDEPVVFHAESRPPRDDEPARGFLLRLHLDPACAVRISPEHALVARRYEQVKAPTLCPVCTEPLVASSRSSVVRRMLEAERTLTQLLVVASQGPSPRESVHCRALRHEAETHRSVHPEAPETAARVIELAGTVADALREALVRYERVH